MHSLTRRIALVMLVIALACGIAAPAQAQGDLSPEEQAAFDAARQAMRDFLALDTYSMTLVQDMNQTITFTAAASTFALVQTIQSEGTLEWQRASEQPFDNRSLDLTQNITQDMRNGSESQVTAIGPNRTRLIAIDGRIYMRMDVQPDLAAFMPGGWQDISEGAGMFPGMDMYNMETLLATGQALSIGYVDQFFGSMIAVELVDPDPTETQAAQRCLITLDAARLLEAIGTETLAGMFAAGLGETLDVASFIEAMFTAPDTVYQLDITLDAHGALLAYAEHMVSNSDVSAAMAASMGDNSTVTLDQDITQTYHVVSTNQPVTITAPDMTEK